ncbi:hypothetical protein R5H30_03470 [Sulfitobacter sp. D35]|uniref:tetratricopeptide repeat protein n=1 Tax=Sulfitobacter sp. D35 TaxID=3083252 RepID=UPI00296EFF48|nr:hypothetical protein [Sulfitobacter sp. D35]MDW4497028.1 hypothetical protein [Sulfitobacter sp. D35]
MSNSDSFIDEVNEEVRRDRLFALIRRYGWIAVLVIVLIVGGAAWNEYRKAQNRAAAETLGDDILAAMGEEDAGLRAQALGETPAETPEARAVLALLTAGSSAEAEETGQAVAELDSVATDGDVPEIYRQIAAFKAVVIQTDTLPPEELRQRFEALAQPGSPLRLLANEQLALLDIREGNTEAALDRYNAILQDAELFGDLQQRALQVIVALGGTPELNGVSEPAE